MSLRSVPAPGRAEWSARRRDPAAVPVAASPGSSVLGMMLTGIISQVGSPIDTTWQLLQKSIARPLRETGYGRAMSGLERIVIPFPAGN